MEGIKIGLLFSTDSLHLNHEVIKCFNFDPHGASPFQSSAGKANLIGLIWKVEGLRLQQAFVGS